MGGGDGFWQYWQEHCRMIGELVFRLDPSGSERACYRGGEVVNVVWGVTLFYKVGLG